MNTTDDLEMAAESLLFDASPEAEAIEEPQDDAPEIEDAELAEEPEDEISEDEATDEVGESDDEDDVTEQSEDDEQPPTYTVKVDGVETTVTLDDLTRSYSGQAYIQKGMQETAEQRKAFEADIAAFQADQQRFADAVQKLQSDGLMAQPQKPDPKMLDTDPVGYMREQARYEAEVSDYTAQQRQIQETSQRASQYEAQQQQQHLQQQAQRLAETIPEFADPKAAKVLKSKLVEVGQSAYGYSADELAGLTDARAVNVLHDAMKWRELQSGTAAAKKTPTPQKTIKPTGRRTQSKSAIREKQLAKARSSGNFDDFASLMLESKT